MAARVAASVVWLTAGGLPLATRVSDLSAVLADWAVTLLGFAAALDSGFLIGTGAFDYTTTCLFRIKFLAVQFVWNLRLRTCRHKFDNTTTYLHPVRPIDVNRTPPLSAKFYCIRTRAWGQETMTRLDSKQKVR